MADKDAAAYQGADRVDVQAIAPLLVDICDKQRQGLQREKPGITDVEAELAVSTLAMSE